MSDVRTRSSEGNGPGIDELVIRSMRLEDIDEVALMERLIFPSPWPRQAFANEVREGDDSLSLVARCRNLLVGYLVGWFVTDEAHMGNIAVVPEFRRRGIATLLTKRFMGEAETRMLKWITLEVRVSNLAAIRFYRGFGFTAISIRQSYYVDNREDAFVMLRELTPPKGSI